MQEAVLTDDLVHKKLPLDLHRIPDCREMETGVRFIACRKCWHGVPGDSSLCSRYDSSKELVLDVDPAYFEGPN